MRALLALALCCFAQTAVALCAGPSFFDRLTPAKRDEIDARAAATPYGSGLIWRATKDEAEMLIIGTMHIYDPRLVPIFDRIKDDIASADILMVEATAEEESEMLRAFAENPDMAFIAEGPTLPERLEPELWDTLAEAAKTRQVPPFLAAKMQPWYLSLTLAIPPCAMGELASGTRGLDHMIMAEAEAQNVPMMALESYTTLLDVLRVGTFEEQIDMLKLSLMTPDLHSEMFVAMLDAYFDEEIAQLWEASRAATQFVPDISEEQAAALFAQMETALLVDRNRAWIPVIEANAKPKTLLAFGAAHLMGEDGVLRLLEQRGWTITAQR